MPTISGWFFYIVGGVLVTLVVLWVFCFILGFVAIDDCFENISFELGPGYR